MRGKSTFLSGKTIAKQQSNRRKTQVKDIQQPLCYHFYCQRKPLTRNQPKPELRNRAEVTQPLRRETPGSPGWGRGQTAPGLVGVPCLVRIQAFFGARDLCPSHDRRKGAVNTGLTTPGGLNARISEPGATGMDYYINNIYCRMHTARMFRRSTLGGNLRNRRECRPGRVVGHPSSVCVRLF